MSRTGVSERDPSLARYSQVGTKIKLLIRNRKITIQGYIIVNSHTHNIDYFFFKDAQSGRSKTQKNRPYLPIALENLIKVKFFFSKGRMVFIYLD